MRRRGFSIIELVLIMGLICLVAAMTIPSLFEAYEAAQRAAVAEKSAAETQVTETSASEN